MKKVLVVVLIMFSVFIWMGVKSSNGKSENSNLSQPVARPVNPRKDSHVHHSATQSSSSGASATSSSASHYYPHHAKANPYYYSASNNANQNE